MITTGYNFTVITTALELVPSLPRVYPTNYFWQSDSYALGSVNNPRYWQDGRPGNMG